MVSENNAAFPPKVWATLVTNDDYLKGVLTLNYRLRCVKSRYPLLVLYTSSLSQTSVDSLKRRNIPTREVPKLAPTTAKDYTDDPRFNECWTKLIAFSLTDYARIVLLDSDMLPLQNMDELMDLQLDSPSLSGSGDAARSKRVFAACHACTCNPLRKPHYPPNWKPENCAFTSQHAAPEIAQTTGADISTGLGKLNSGLLVINPSKAIFDQIIAKMDEAGLDYQFPDQDLLADLFKGRWVALPYIYNALKTMREPSVHGAIWCDDKVKNVHYILSPKPWDELGPDGTWKEVKPIHKWWIDAYKSMRAEEKTLGIS
ncbi:glycosyltransferase family 8 protein [Fusarium redolens]|uniref:Glycosyltransferase family 8 protein n=1 Tax=Fusarium redolens TaxID=48865 RepID=A0A9P9JR37_FUSRE|nr:glycosyltransferase family 8 protein [Fusarium redolens]KAH7222606.1 glycosyltransferase family 8 protein [Fusarium redolens]